MLNFPTGLNQTVHIPCEKISLNGLLSVPTGSKSIILFVHGSGSSRLSPRNQQIAKALNKSKFSTLLFDLLTPEEDKIDNDTMEYRFNIGFLADRLIAATEWVRQHQALSHLTIGYFGASTGGGAALVAAAKLQDAIKALVSRGGRPDLAKNFLVEVNTPTLLIVGGYDIPVIELNKIAFENLNCIKELQIVPEASHLFEEPGKLKVVEELADAWFREYL